MKKVIGLSIIFLYLNIFSMSEPDIKLVNNSISEINSKMGKISLKYVRTWSDEDKKEDEYCFKTPADIAVDGNDNVYIADSALHCIKVFHSNGRFIRQIGTKGQGPGDLMTPLHIGINADNILWVYEFGNRRIQAFSDKGVSLAIFKIDIPITSNLVFPTNRQIALLDFYSTKKGDGIITVFNNEGVQVQKIGTDILPPKVDLPWRGGEFDSHEIAYHTKEQQYCVAYRYSQMIQIFQKTGKLISCILYETPINKLKMSWKPRNRNFDIITKKKNYSDCVDVHIDDDGRLFIIITTRPPVENERRSMIFVSGGEIQYVPLSKKYPEKTDMYRLMVFGTDGKILAAKQLDFFCDNIYIHKNSIFMIDKTFNQAIYEYHYTIED